MKTIDLKSVVAKAIESNWPDFAKEHAHLAAAIDQSLLIEQAADLLEDDPAYGDALRKAQAIGIVADSFNAFITTWVSKWLRSLV